MTELTLKERQDSLFAALKSERYKQGTGALNTTDQGNYGFCCLGVACDVFRTLTGKGEWKECDETRLRGPLMDFILGESTESFELPQEVQDFFGFKTRNGNAVSDRPDMASPLMCMVNLNDGRLLPFPAIAEIIETNREAYFVTGDG